MAEARRVRTRVYAAVCTFDTRARTTNATGTAVAEHYDVDCAWADPQWVLDHLETFPLDPRADVRDLAGEASS